MRELSSAVKLGHFFMSRFLEEGMIALDATAGNGQDTLLLSQLVGKSGHVYSFDIQESALENTKRVLAQHGCTENVTLIQDSHRNLFPYIKEGRLDFGVFNLGYLPGGDKSITTNGEEVIEALEKAMELLCENAAIFIIAYPGHGPGKEELLQLEKFFSVLLQENFSVLKSFFLNQRNHPPVGYLLQKITSNGKIHRK